MISAIERGRRWAAATLLGLAITSVAAAPPPTETGIRVEELHLRMDETDARALFLKEPNDRSVFVATAVHDGKEIPARIAVKGSSSRLFHKKSLLLSLAPGQSIGGRRRFALNAMATDPTQSREWQIWDLIHKLGMLAPATLYQRVFINDQLIGLYFDIEWMDNTMFERLGQSGKFEFLQPSDQTGCGDLFITSVESPENCWVKVAPRDSDFKSIKELVTAMDAVPLAQFDDFLDSHFVADSVIDWLVVNAVVQNTDTYNKNYWLYRNQAEGKWRIIPWDYDLTWGRVADGALDFPPSVFNDRHQYTFPPDAGADNLLKQKVLRNPVLYGRFLNRLRTVLGLPGGDTAHPAFAWFTAEAFDQRMARIAQLIAPTYASEAYNRRTTEELERYREAMRFFATARHHVLSKLLFQPSPFDTPRWQPYQIIPVLTPVTPETLKLRRRNSMPVTAMATLTEPNRPYFLSDELLVWLQAIVTLREGPTPLRLSIESEREIPPIEAPSGLGIAECIERTWNVTIKGRDSALFDFVFDYLDEGSTRTEVGPDIAQESALVLWHFDGSNWRHLPTHTNAIANTLAVTGLKLVPNITHRFLACPKQ